MYFGRDRTTSDISCEAYASDASIYRVLPQMVYCPETEDDTRAIASRAIQSAIPITPRGGGTGLAGGALGAGWIIDCSRLTEIKQISIENKTITAQPGIIYRDLNLALKKDRLFFPPDPSSGDSCQIGGMLANNSSGPRSVKYGLTSHYVEALTIINASGQTVGLQKLPIASHELNTFFDRHPEYKKIFSLLDQNKDLITDRWPKVKKNSAGYNLHQVVDDLRQGICNLPALYIGSEGTLGLFLDVTLRLLPLPDGNQSYRLFFASLENAGAAVVPLLATGPSSLEIVDGSSLNLIGREKHKIPAQAEAMLMLEYDDDLDRRDALLSDAVKKLTLAVPIERAATDADRQALWAARKAIVPTLYRHDAVKRPIPFIEDASLPIDQLVPYISWVRQRLESEHLTFGLFGHIGDGNLHIRPLLDLSSKHDLSLAERLYNEAYEKMFELGGSSTAEHADGRLRAPVLRRLYGDEIYTIFQQIKNILDPSGMFNPDVILSKRSILDDIDLTKLELTCAACGKCNGYCPAFEIFRREDMSPRGWLRMLKFGGHDNEKLSDFYRYCLNCKNCTTVCPAGVDIAGEILRYKAAHPHKNAGRVISFFDTRSLFGAALKVGAFFDPLMRTSIGRKMTAAIGRRPFGFDETVVLPSPAGKTLRDRHPDLCRQTDGVALFHGCADNYFASSAGDAIVNIFRHFSGPLAMPPQNCCGLPMEVYGHRDNLIQKAKFNIDSLEPFDAVVFTCASCLHRLADYPELFDKGTPYHRKALALRSKLYDICQYLLAQEIPVPTMKSSGPVRVSYHHPCHLRAAGLEKEPLRLLEKIDGLETLHPELAGRCCGQAGSFGFTHYREGRAMFADKKREYLDLNPQIIVSSCPSCISKVRKEMGDAIRVCHPVELIADIIAGKPLYEQT